MPSNGSSFTVVTTPPLPAVVQVQPANTGTNFPINGRVVVRFAQPVQAASIVTGTVSITQGATNITGTIAPSNDGLSLTFIPAQNLSALTPYAVSVQDVAGHQGSPEFQSTFTTGSTSDTTAPQVMQTSPQGQESGVPINSVIMIQFTKAMDPSTLTLQNFGVFDGMTGQNIAGVVQVDATGRTASFVPQSNLPIWRAIIVNLSSFQDTAGNTLGFTGFSFTTSFGADSNGPNLLGASPSNGATAVPLNSVIVLEFDEPLASTSVSNGFQVQFGGFPIAGGIALSNGNKRITFTPQSALTANATYSIITGAQITDLTLLPLVNPTTFTFTTSTTSDTTTPNELIWTPASNATGIPTNVVVELQFSKQIDPITVVPSTLALIVPNGSAPIPATIAVSANGRNATLTPNTPLENWSTYYIYAPGGITDLEGHSTPYFISPFTTGAGAVGTGPTVVIVSPRNGMPGVPVNAQVHVVMSTPVNGLSVGTGAITVSAAGTPVTGTVSVSGDQTTLTFVPGSALATSTTYTVTVAGFTDQAGNSVVPFTSVFTTAASGAPNTTHPTVVSVSPVFSVTEVPVTSSVVLTFNEPLDPTTLNANTIQLTASGVNSVFAGSYSLGSTGTVLTFTPLSPLPGNSTISVSVSNGVLDLSGNTSNYFSSWFATVGVVDTTAPAVTMVTPTNGATGIGLNARVVLNFSKSLNINTLNQNLAVLVNGTKISSSFTASADAREVTLIPGSMLPPSSTITVIATNGIADIDGNGLVNYQSQFTTTTAVDTRQPSVVNQRPGNGATAVPLSTSVVLYLSEPMNVSSIMGALHIAQNGLPVSGTLQVTDNGQVILFTPASAWQPHSLIQTFLDSTAQDLAGNTAISYQGSFTALVDASTSAPSVLNTNPAAGVNAVPTNVVIGVQFSQTLNPATVNTTTVQCTQNIAVPITVSLIGGGTIVRIVPTSALLPNTFTQCQIGNGVQGTNGVAFPGTAPYFTTGTGTDTTPPTVLSASPLNGLTNVGDNADVDVTFSKPINPLTISGGTIQLSGGILEVPDAISFANNNQRVLLVPHTPLPDATLMTLTISGVTDLAGNAVAAQTTHFTTGKPRVSQIDRCSRVRSLKLLHRRTVQSRKQTVERRTASV